MATRKKAKSGSDRQLLRHTLATLAYRGGKALRDVPEGFAGFRAGDKTRTPGQILAHMCDLLDWALSLAKGAQKWHNSPALPWKDGTDRFFWALRAFDKFLVSDAPLGTPASGALSGPDRGCFHPRRTDLHAAAPGGRTGARRELSSSRRYQVGRVGPKQTTPKREFD